MADGVREVREYKGAVILGNVDGIGNGRWYKGRFMVSLKADCMGRHMV